MASMKKSMKRLRKKSRNQWRDKEETSLITSPLLDSVPSSSLHNVSSNQHPAAFELLPAFAVLWPVPLALPTDYDQALPLNELKEYQAGM